MRLFRLSMKIGPSDRLHILCPSVSPELLVTWQDCSRKAAPYDVFRKDLLGTPVWMEAVQDLDTAKLRMSELAGRSPGQYFIYSQDTQEIVSETTPRAFELAS
jgi:hypothetical protein